MNAERGTTNERQSLFSSSFRVLRSSFERFRPARPVYKTWWGALFALLLVVGGTAAGALTYLAGQANDPELAYYGAIACFIFVGAIMLFVVPPLARAARAEVRAVEFPVRLTAGGFLFLVMLLTIALAAWNTGNNVLFLIFSVMVSTLFVQWAAARVVLRDTGVAVRFPDHIFASEAAMISVALQNFKRVLPSLFISIEARERDLTYSSEPGGKGARRAGAGRRARHLIARFEYVGRGAKVEQRVERHFMQRGEILIEGFTLSTVFPFGLFELRRRLRTREVRLVIYPAMEAIRTRFNLTPLKRIGEARAARRGQGADLFGLREYQAGDDRRHIDWKATARTRRLTVREFAAEELIRARVLFDRTRYDAADEDWTPRFEHGVTLAASLIAHFIQQGGDVALTITGKDTTDDYGSDQSHLYDSLRRLATVSPDDATAPNSASNYTPSIELLSTQASNEGAHFVLITAAPTRNTLPRTMHVIGY